MAAIVERDSYPAQTARYIASSLWLSVTCESLSHPTASGLRSFWMAAYPPFLSVLNVIIITSQVKHLRRISAIKKAIYNRFYSAIMAILQSLMGDAMHRLINVTDSVLGSRSWKLPKRSAVIAHDCRL